MSSPLPVSVVRQHARDRLAEYYPGASIQDALRASEPISMEIGLRLTGRAFSTKRDRTEYLLHPERTGLFAAVDGVVMTFLRFEVSQYRLAVRLFGPGLPVSPSVPWAGHLAPAIVPAKKPEPVDADRVPVVFNYNARVAASAKPVLHGVGLAGAWLSLWVLPSECPSPVQLARIGPRRVKAPAYLFLFRGQWLGLYRGTNALAVALPIFEVGTMATRPATEEDRLFARRVRLAEMERLRARGLRLGA